MTLNEAMAVSSSEVQCATAMRELFTFEPRRRFESVHEASVTTLWGRFTGEGRTVNEAVKDLRRQLSASGITLSE